MGSSTIYYDGSFWVGLFIRQEEEGDLAALHVFGSEPGNAEILDFISNHYDNLVFYPLDSEEWKGKYPPKTGNYKSSLRKARREMNKVPGGKSRQIYRDAQKAELEKRKAQAARNKRAAGEEAYSRRREKKKKKKRGH